RLATAGSRRRGAAWTACAGAGTVTACGFRVPRRRCTLAALVHGEAKAHAEDSGGQFQRGLWQDDDRDEPGRVLCPGRQEHRARRYRPAGFEPTLVRKARRLWLAGAADLRHPPRLGWPHPPRYA